MVRLRSLFLALLSTVLALPIFVCCTGDEASLTPNVRSLKPTAVPLIRDSTDALVQLSIGGVDSLRFLLDSEGQSLILSPRVRAMHSLSFPQISYDDPSGMPMVRLDSFRLGDLTFGPTRAHVAEPPMSIQRRWGPGRPYDGLLGWSVLGRLDMAYSLANDSLYLFPRDPKYRNDLWSVVPEDYRCASFHRHDGEVQLTVGGQSFDALLDTGASPSVVTWDVARAAGITRQDAHKLDERTRGIDTSATGAPTYVAVFGPAQIGSVSLASAKVRIVGRPDRSAENQWGETLIGNDLLAGGVVIQADSAGQPMRHVCRPEGEGMPPDLDS